jgi:hypothetical protein
MTAQRFQDRSRGRKWRDSSADQRSIIKTRPEAPYSVGKQKHVLKIAINLGLHAESVGREHPDRRKIRPDVEDNLVPRLSGIPVLAIR